MDVSPAAPPSPTAETKSAARPSAGSTGPPPRTGTQGWLRRLTGDCLRHRRQVGLALGGALAGMAATATIPLVQRTIIDDAIITHRRPIWPLAAVMVLVAAVVYAGTYLRRYYGGKLALDVQHDLRNGIFDALSRMDGARQDQVETGQIIGRATSDLTMVQGLLQTLPVQIGNGLLFILSLGAMVVLSPVLTLIAVAVAPAVYVLARLARGRLFAATWVAQQDAGAVAGVVDDAINGVRVVKGFGQEEQELDKLSAASRLLFATRMRMVKLTSRYNPSLQAVPALGQVGVLALGGWLTLHGSITLGTFLAFSAYLAQLVGPVRQLSNLLTVAQQARASVVRVFEVIDSRPVIAEAPDAVALDATDAPGIEFDEVTFGYLPSQPVLRGLSLNVRAGETMAVIGAAGSGKSTISLLLPRFYDPSAGAVRVGGHDVRTLTLDSLRAGIGLVAETSFLFSESVRANIAFGRPEATHEEVEAAARAAEAHEFIAALPDGYDTVVGEQGLTLSGGQRQRVALARALLTDPRLLLLDDATSAVDARVEAAIHATLRSVMRGRTTLLIAHRRSTLALADRIAVLEAGRVADVGTHEELIGRCAAYRLLVSGPGADAEGIDAGDLPVPEEVDPTRSGGLTLALWPPVEEPAAVPGFGEASSAARAGAVSVAAIGRMGRTSGRQGANGLMSSAMAGLPADGALAARIAALPPARDVPTVDESAARRGDAHFTLSRLVRPMALPFALAMILVALDALATLVLPVLTRTGVDSGVQRGSLAVILTVSAIGLAVVIADWFVSVVQTWLTGRTGERLLYTLRVKTFAHLQRLGLDYYERELSGRIMTRMTTDIDAFSSFLQTGLTQAAVSVLTFLGILVALLVINVELGLVMVATLPFMVVATLVFRSKSSRAYLDAREKVGIVNADLQENVAGMRITQAYRREEHNRRRFARRSDDYRVSRARAQRYIAMYFPFVQFLSSVAAALVMVAGGPLVRAGTLSAGALIAYLLYIDMFFAPVQQLSQVFDGYQQASVGLRRVRDLLRTPTSTPAASHPVPVPGRLRGAIRLDAVRFAYRGGGPEALSGVDVAVEPGETVALVGQTGAGKSTVVKLISRFYDATSGALRVDGTDVREFDLAGYRHRIGVIPQEAYLFGGTIRDAIAYGRPGATDAEVEAAARAVGAHRMISTLADGYRHRVAERGHNLSAGQRQLIALARAELVDPDILLMDEATAALDLATEAEVTRALDRLARRRTTIVVAHRLTTAARADRIVVLAHGQVVESGSHTELLARDGAYAAQWRAYSGAEVGSVLA
ncbi:ABC transporter ATP-binding protein [Rugosimonospora acidiphila]|uniref:ABC transporter ATP-binding protein n=1 Tax=Rugosimonospora acidiphila TaxID=556531 RepID=A0ABP9S2L4_9ACTN